MFTYEWEKVLFEITNAIRSGFDIVNEHEVYS